MRAKREEREVIALCESCEKLIYERDKACFCADGTVLCEEHAYSLQDVANQHEEILSRVPFDCGELAYETRDEMVKAYDRLKADLAKNGDRKILSVA